MRVIPVEEWTPDGEYLPVAHINKPITEFAAQFDAATAPLKSGTPGLRFREAGRQFILREIAEDNTTELLLPLRDATKTPRSIGKVEDNLIAAFKDLGLRLPQVTSLHKDLKRERVEWIMGFGLREGSGFDLQPIDP